MDTRYLHEAHLAPRACLPPVRRSFLLLPRLLGRCRWHSPGTALRR
ncbi:hypothetical protein HMPREF0058_1409 [Actinomyces urogenitalis DSM 15434]|uniref:Uncharacterized protein n=1 Tax=Actinomyces urogenitalis DSM 15434 TaxID=525246 RepID=C0W6B5_9ACTO|nr:hypothetical protein HMPREF0058_1409 [Actinomyces urogenitalis DSM 15434]